MGGLNPGGLSDNFLNILFLLLIFRIFVSVESLYLNLLFFKAAEASEDTREIRRAQKITFLARDSRFALSSPSSLLALIMRKENKCIRQIITVLDATYAIILEMVTSKSLQPPFTRPENVKLRELLCLTKEIRMFD